MAVKWSPEGEKASIDMKESLANVPIRKTPGPDRPYYIRTDSSNYAIGAVVKQGDANGEHY